MENVYYFTPDRPNKIPAPLPRQKNVIISNTLVCSVQEKSTSKSGCSLMGNNFHTATLHMSTSSSESDTSDEEMTTSTVFNFSRYNNQTKDRLLPIALVGGDTVLNLRVQEKYLQNFAAFCNDVSEPSKRVLLQKSLTFGNPEKVLLVRPLLTEEIIQAEYRTSRKMLKPNKIINCHISLISVYQLETFYEKRHVSTKKKAFEGSLPSSYHPKRSLHTISSPWEIDIDLKDECKSKVIEIPGTQSIVSCESCSGRGRTICKGCSGVGYKKCESCYGLALGCKKCKGNGGEECQKKCNQGKQPCKDCLESGKQRKFQQVTAKWEKIVGESYSSNDYNLPVTFLRQCQGWSVYEEESTHKKLNPLSTENCLNLNVISLSESIMAKHGNASSTNKRIRKQKHSLSVLPIYKVDYEKKSKIRNLFIVGMNQAVYDSSTTESLCRII